MAPVEVESIRTTDPMVILRSNGRSTMNFLIIYAAYDTVQQRTLLPFKK